MRRITAVLTFAALSIGLSIPASVTAQDPPNEQKSVKKRAGPGPGDIPPPSLGRTRDGDEIDTTQYAGKVLVVTFWASWCGPCRAELPVLEGLKKAARGSVEVVAVNIESREQFRALARHLSSLTVTLTHDNGKRQHDAYGVNGIPHMVIIGRDGKILNIHRGYSEASLDGFVAEINAALAKG